MDMSIIQIDALMDLFQTAKCICIFTDALVTTFFLEKELSETPVGRNMQHLTTSLSYSPRSDGKSPTHTLVQTSSATPPGSQTTT